MALTSSCAHALGKKQFEPVRPPIREVCILGTDGCICFDPRVPKEIQSYIRKYGSPESSGGCLNFVATNPRDNDAVNEFHLTQCYGPPRQK